MRYFHHPETNEVYAYEADGSQDVFIKPGLIPISAEDAHLLRNPPPTEGQIKAAVQAEIERLERESLMNRGTRELNLQLMEREAQGEAGRLTQAGTPATAEQLLSMASAYVKFKALDDQIAALRAKL